MERAIRPVALGRKNALFAGADSGGRHWAIIASLIQTAKLNDVDPLAWLTDVLERIVSGRTRRHELGMLLPWDWKRKSVTTAAEWLGVSRQSLSELLNGRNGVSADMAIRLEKAGWSTAETWLGVQTAYDLWQAKQHSGSIHVKRYPTPNAPAPA